MDAFDRFWQWAEKPLDSPLTIPAELHWAVMELAPENRSNREKVNEAASRSEVSAAAGARVRPQTPKRPAHPRTVPEAHRASAAFARFVSDKVRVLLLSEDARRSR